jgi:FolB domain-containing protein
VNDVVELRDLRCSVVVGVLPNERDLAQPLSFDLDLYRPFTLAARTDDLSATTNYADVLALTVEIATNGQFFLLETLAHRVAQAVLDFDDQIDRVSVVVRKLEPPVTEDVATVGVRCTLDRMT